MVLINRILPDINRCVALDDRYGAPGLATSPFDPSRAIRKMWLICSNLGDISDAEDRLQGYSRGAEESGSWQRPAGHVCRASSGGEQAMTEPFGRAATLAPSPAITTWLAPPARWGAE